MYKDPEKISAWDYQWVYTCFSQSGLCIIPNTNLISNLGFGPDATHMPNKNDQLALELSDIFEINHPPFVVVNKEADHYDFDHTFSGLEMRRADKFVPKIRRRLASLRRIMSI
jgi:hypothetical protein